jgi:hypothetical protein
MYAAVQTAKREGVYAPLKTCNGSKLGEKNEEAGPHSLARAECPLKSGKSSSRQIFFGRACLVSVFLTKHDKPNTLVCYSF